MEQTSLPWNTAENSTEHFCFVTGKEDVVNNSFLCLLYMLFDDSWHCSLLSILSDILVGNLKGRLKKIMNF